MVKRLLRIVLVSTLCVGMGASTGAAATNVTLGADVTLHGGTFFTGGWGSGLTVSPATLVDGVFLPRSTQWDQGAVWWDNNDGGTRWIEIDLGQTATIESLVVQADDNDGYRLHYWDAGSSSWLLAWDIPAVGGYGMQTRPNPMDDTQRYVLGSPIVTSLLKLEGNPGCGDLWYSASEVQAYGTVIPAPGAVVLGGIGEGLVMRLRRRRAL